MAMVFCHSDPPAGGEESGIIKIYAHQSFPLLPSPARFVEALARRAGGLMRSG